MANKKTTVANNDAKSAADKVADGKKASAAADKKKIKTQMKAAADKLLTEMAADAPMNGGKTFVQRHKIMKKIKSDIKVLQMALQSERKAMKADLKIDLRAYDRVCKLEAMEPEDVRAMKTTEALYEKQLAMPLSEEQKELINDISKKREESRATMMASVPAADTGKEIGSAGGIPERVDMTPAAGITAAKHEAPAQPGTKPGLHLAH